MIDKKILIGAENGIKQDMFTLANYYYDIKKYQLAFYWMQKSSDKKYLPAIYALSLFHAQGIGTNVDIQKAQKLLYRSAKCNYPQAIVTFTAMIFSQKTYEKVALNFAKKTAKINVAIGEYFIGMCYLLGFGTKKNIEYARAHLTISAVSGLKEAQNELNNKEFRVVA